MADTITLTKSDRQYLLQKFKDFKDSYGCRDGEKCLILSEAAKIRLKSQLKNEGKIERYEDENNKINIELIKLDDIKLLIGINRCYPFCTFNDRNGIKNPEKYQKTIDTTQKSKHFYYRNGDVYIQIDKILELFDDFVLCSSDLSWITFKRLVGKLNKNQEKISINKNAVIFFCAALKVKLEELQGYEANENQIKPTSIPISHAEAREEKIKMQRFNECLARYFNYDSELAQLEKFALSCNHRMQLYSLIGDDRRYFQWMIKRIKYKIQEWSYLKDCVIIDDISVTSSSINFSCEYLENRLGEKIKINKLKKELNERNIIMIIKNVDCLDPCSLQDIILNQFWNQLKQSVSQSMGFFLMIWLSQNNLHFVNSDILQDIPIIPLRNQFDREDFVKIIEQLAIALNDKINWNDNTVNWLLEQSNGGNPEKTFTAFHQNLQVN
ncbi:MAG: hypothetical protein QNJ33_18305 [Crocosphaera sp.]|nr:hypothetical protein [Crocosphaera sp.]